TYIIFVFELTPMPVGPSPTGMSFPIFVLFSPSITESQVHFQLECVQFVLKMTDLLSHTEFFHVLLDRGMRMYY
ncbi:MAG: hypothetical protein WBY28_12340, partial [Nitrososphaeraceae archaeon]